MKDENLFISLLNIFYDHIIRAGLPHGQEIRKSQEKLRNDISQKKSGKNGDF